MTARRVAVAMSGGVDSSVAAALLVEQGEDVFGVMLRLWSAGEEGGAANRCCSPQDVADARRVAQQLGIPFYVLDARETFKRFVVDFFLDGYAKGVTPNPCLECNRHIRWGFLLDHAVALGATHLATGHYARAVERDGCWLLHRAVDRDKDQSYVLSVLGQGQLARALFPIGDYTKDEVRAHARRLGLPVADRRESQDLCFLGDADYRAFVRAYAASPPTDGPIVDRLGRILGRHHGLADYTIGQRRGLGISAPQPLYVVDKQAANNTLVVGPREALGRRTFFVRNANWVAGTPPASPFEASVRVRYKAKEVRASVQALRSDQVRVDMAESVPDVTPGQAAVFYDGPVCLGGGIILP